MAHAVDTQLKVPAPLLCSARRCGVIATLESRELVVTLRTTALGEGSDRPGAAVGGKGGGESGGDDSGIDGGGDGDDGGGGGRATSSAARLAETLAWPSTIWHVNTTKAATRAATLIARGPDTATRDRSASTP